MKTPKLVLSVLACSVVVGNYAQNIPTHAPYVELLPTKEISIAGGDKKQSISIFMTILNLGNRESPFPKTRTSTSPVSP